MQRFSSLKFLTCNSMWLNLILFRESSCFPMNFRLFITYTQIIESSSLFIGRTLYIIISLLKLLQTSNIVKCFFFSITTKIHVGNSQHSGRGNNSCVLSGDTVRRCISPLQTSDKIYHDRHGLRRWSQTSQQYTYPDFWKPSAKQTSCRSSSSSR